MRLRARNHFAGSDAAKLVPRATHSFRAARHVMPSCATRIHPSIVRLVKSIILAGRFIVGIGADMDHPFILDNAAGHVALVEEAQAAGHLFSPIFENRSPRTPRILLANPSW